MAAALDNQKKFHYNILAFGVWRSLVSRLVRVQEARGSNPLTPTKIKGAANAAPFILVEGGFENPNATRTSVAGEGSTEPLLNFRPFPGENANESPHSDQLKSP